MSNVEVFVTQERYTDRRMTDYVDLYVTNMDQKYSFLLFWAQSSYLMLWSTTVSCSSISDLRPRKKEGGTGNPIPDCNCATIAVCFYQERWFQINETKSDLQVSYGCCIAVKINKNYTERPCEWNCDSLNHTVHGLLYSVWGYMNETSLSWKCHWTGISETVLVSYCWQAALMIWIKWNHNQAV